MSKKMYSLKDVLAGGFDDPFNAPNNVEAIRYMKIAISNPKSRIANFANDFQLWCVGTFDDTEGYFNEDGKGFVCNLAELRENSIQKGDDNDSKQ